MGAKPSCVTAGGQFALSPRPLFLIGLGKVGGRSDARSTYGHGIYVIMDTHMYYR